MNILIINCHIDNRGDEAAVHALIDELNLIYRELSITLAMRGKGRYPNLPSNVNCINQYMPARPKSVLANRVSIITRGKINLSKSEGQMIDAIKNADIILHAPGGPSIGDTYYKDEPSYLRIFDLIKALDKPYLFYAPSMGPFKIENRNHWRKRVLCNACAVALRDPVSAGYVKKLLPEINVYLTLDSALQHDIDITLNQNKLDNYKDLKEFLGRHKKCIGITITDLLWHPIYSQNIHIKDKVHSTFYAMINYLIKNGFGVVFIPQLYGSGNDYDLMKKYVISEDSCFIVKANDTEYDAYFQQYLISKLYMVIGMRYHSNIFSAKMGTPFISISYEQKMKGFMEKMKLSNYCISIEELSFDLLKSKIEDVNNNYEDYKKYLMNLHDSMKSESLKTTELVQKIVKDINSCV